MNLKFSSYTKVPEGQANVHKRPPVPRSFKRSGRNWKFGIDKYLKLLLAPTVFLVVTTIFFYPIFKGEIPFPGDLLVGHYTPYNSNTYEGYGPGAVPHKAQGPDVVRELFPWKFFVINSLKSFSIPFWNPYNFSGNPLLANFQSAVFYPLNIIFFVLPFNSAWTLFIFLSPFLSAFFTYLYMREIGIGKVAGIFTGIVYAFCAYMAVWMEYGNIGHTMLWLPLALYITEKCIKKLSAKRLLILIFFLTLPMLGGYIQGMFYILAVLATYFIVGNLFQKTFTIKNTGLFLLALLFPVLLTLFQVLPTLSIFSQSSRGNYSLEIIKTLLNPWWYGITVVAPDYFGNPASRNNWFNGTYIERVSYFGLIPLVFAIYALLNANKRREIISLGIILVTAFLLAFDFFFTKFIYRIPIPIISTTVPTRILCLFAFSGAILAGIGLQMFLQHKNIQKFFISISLPASVLFIGWLTVFFAPIVFHDQNWIINLAISKRNLIFPTLQLFGLVFVSILYLYKKKMQQLFIMVVVLLTIFDLFRFFQKITPFSPQAYVYPQTPVIKFIQENAGLNRFWGYGSGYIDSNFQTYDKTFSPEGNDPLHIKTYTEFLESSKNGKLSDSLPRPDANLASGFGKENLKENYYRQKVMNILGIKYVIHKDESLGEMYAPDYTTFDPNTYKLVWQKKPWQIYENTQAVPRLFLTTLYSVIPEKNDILATFYARSFNEKTKIILQEDPDVAQVKLKRKQLQVLHYLPNEIKVKVNIDNESLLFVSDNYFPEWKAAVDNIDTKVYIADYAFRAVKVPKGEHIVRFYYEPESFNRGIKISLFFFIILFAITIINKKYKFI
jgi:hypothetical protein